MINDALQENLKADKVIKSIRVDIFERIYGKKNHVKYAFEYGRILGVNELKGYENNVHFELVFK